MSQADAKKAEKTASREASSGGEGGLSVGARRALVAAAVAVVTGGFHVGVLSLRASGDFSHIWSNAAWTLMSLLAALKCFQTARRKKRTHQRRAWSAFGLGAFSWFVGMLIWDYYEHVAGITTPFPMVSDIFFLALAPAFLAGFLWEKKRAPSVGLTLQQIGDLGIAISMMVMVSTIMFYRQLFSIDATPAYIAATLAYPILHLTALFYSVFSLLQHAWGRDRFVVVLQVVSLATLAFVTTLYGHSLITQSYEAGHDIDVFWIATFALLIWSAYEDDWSSQAKRDEPVRTRTRLDLLVPAVSVLVLVGCLFAFREHWHQELEPIFLGAGIGLALFMGLRAFGSHQVETQLLEEVVAEEKRFRKLVNEAPIGIAYISPSGRIRMANQQLASLTTTGNVQLIRGREWVESGVSQQIETSLENNTKSSEEHVLRLNEESGPASGGSWERHIQVSVSPLAGGGAFVLVLDSSEEKMLQRQLVQAQKMEAVGTLAGGIAHDFNNLLTSMLAGVSLVRLKVRADDKLAGQLEQMEQSMWRAAELTQRLLTLSRKQEAKMAPMRPADVVRRVAKLLERSISETIEIRVDIEEEDLTILGDEGQVEQALLNLGINARDAMPDGGRLKLGVYLNELTASSARTDPGAYVVISVSDTGHGIPEDLQSRVFEPFFTTKAAGEGTGLGLAMVYSSMKEQGGWAAVSSVKGRGTTFSLYLPARHAKLEGAQPSSRDEFPTGTESVLVVDDRDAPLLAAKGILEGCGYEVKIAWSAEEALARLEDDATHIDIIVTDAVMPGMGGRKLLESVRKRGYRTPLILTSGYEREAQKSGNHEFAAVLAKPYDAKQLARTVRQVLDAQGELASSA